MASEINEETYYDLLKVNPKATIGEIVAAYHRTKSAFSKDSVATYSLLTEQETQAMLQRLDEAYATLCNLEKRSEYDRCLHLKAQKLPIPVSRADLASQRTLEPVRTSCPSLPVAPAIESLATLHASPSFVENFDGPSLKQLREKKGWSVEDVSRVTKIPSKFVQALEVGDVKRLPARVYIQGFIKNIATLHRLDPQTVVKSYLQAIDRPVSGSQGK